MMLVLPTAPEKISVPKAGAVSPPQFTAREMVSRRRGESGWVPLIGAR